MLEERMKLCAELWAAGIKTELEYKPNPKIQAQFQRAEKDQIPYLAIIGPDELSRGIVKLRTTVSREEVEIPRVRTSQRDLHCYTLLHTYTVVQPVIKSSSTNGGLTFIAYRLTFRAPFDRSLGRSSRCPSHFKTQRNVNLLLQPAKIPTVSMFIFVYTLV